MTVFKTDFDIMKASLVATIFGIGGWMGFSGVRELFDIEALSPFIKIGLSVLIFWIGFKTGLKKD